MVSGGDGGGMGGAPPREHLEWGRGWDDTTRGGAGSRVGGVGRSPPGFPWVWERRTPRSHLLLQLAELGAQAVDADARLLQLLVRGARQVAVPLRRLLGVLQLGVRAGRGSGVRSRQWGLGQAGVRGQIRGGKGGGKTVGSDQVRRSGGQIRSRSNQVKDQD